MLTTKKLRRRPRHFARFTGLSVAEFDQLCQQVQAAYADQAQARKTQHARQRAVGAGRPFTLSVEDRLLATLLYFRLYVTGALLSYLFNLDESNLSRERHERMLPALQAVLPLPMQDHLLSALEATVRGTGGAPPRKRISSLAELLQAHPELAEVWIDATEQEVPKPHPQARQGKSRRRLFYSGKSHCHTIKTQVVTSGRLILHVFGGCPGAVHDRQVLRAAGVMRTLPALLAQPGDGLPVARKVRLDRGYCGAEEEWAKVPAVEVVIGVKGTRKRPLNVLERAWNAMLSRKRMQVEQCLGHLKN